MSRVEKMIAELDRIAAQYEVKDLAASLEGDDAVITLFSPP